MLDIKEKPLTHLYIVELKDPTDNIKEDFEYLADDICGLDSFNSNDKLENWRNCWIENTLLIATNGTTTADFNEVYKVYKRYLKETGSMKVYYTSLENVGCYPWFCCQDETYENMKNEFRKKSIKNCNILFDSNGTLEARMKEDFASIL